MERPTAAARDGEGCPLDRDDLARTLSVRVMYGGDPLPVLSDGEGVAVAVILLEYAALHADEPLGELADVLRRRIYTRLGYRVDE